MRPPFLQLILLSLMICACYLPVDHLPHDGVDAASSENDSGSRKPDAAGARSDTCTSGVNGSELGLNVPYHSQISETRYPGNPSTACGPTALLMVLDYLGLETQLSTVIEHLVDIDPHEGGYDPACSSSGNPVCTSAGALVRVAVEQYDLLVEAGDHRTERDIRRALCNGHPVITLVQSNPAASRGHFVTVIGTRTRGADRWVIYHDPLRQAGVEARWEDFLASWQGPVDLDDPLQPQGHAFWGMVSTMGPERSGR